MLFDFQNLEQIFNIQLSAETIEKIKVATTYQQFATIRNEQINQHFMPKINDSQILKVEKATLIKQQRNERVIWISWLNCQFVNNWLIINEKKGERKIKQELNGFKFQQISQITILNV